MRNVLASLRRSPAAALGIGLMAAGFAAMYLGWRGAAATLLVPTQFAFLASGGVAGLALVVIGAAAVDLQATRSRTAAECAALDRLIDEALVVAAAADRAAARRR